MAMHPALTALIRTNRSERYNSFVETAPASISAWLSGENRRCNMYAILTSGNKQYKVQEGDIITVEKLDAEPGSAYDFDQVLALGGDGSDLNIGSPYLSGAKVSASVIGNGKEKKVIIYKFKAKKGFHKKKGHRQPFTKLKIEKIIAG